MRDRPKPFVKTIAGGLDELIEGLAGGGQENVAANLSICDRVNGLSKPEE